MVILVYLIFYMNLQKQIQVFSSDIVESAEISAGRDRLGPYTLGDLVVTG
jgi:hypothetical protein